MKRPPTRRLQSGFTLIELLMTLVLLAVLLALAAPNVRQFMANQRLKTTAIELVSALNYTRSEAVKRNATSTLEADGSWSESWVLISGGENMRTWTVPEGLEIDMGQSKVSYQGDGRADGAHEFTLCNAEPGFKLTRRIVRVDPSGRPNLTQGEACE